MARSVTGVSMTIDDGGTIKRLGIAIDTFAINIEDWSELFADIQVSLESNESNLFLSEGRSVGGGWKALTEPYATRKRAKWGSQRILHASGMLMKSLTNASHSDAIREQTASQYAFGSSVPYADVHMGVRSPIDWGPDLEAAITADLRRHVKREATSAGLDYRDTPGDVTGDVLPDVN